MRKALATTVLMLVLCHVTVAGVMPTPGSPAPPPTTANVVQEPADTTQEPTGGEISNDSPDSLTQTVLDLIALLPLLL